VLGTKFKNFLVGFDSTDQRTSDSLSIEHKWKLRNLMRSSDETNLNDSTTFSKKTKIITDLMSSRNSIKNNVTFWNTFLCFWVTHSNVVVSTNFKSQILLSSRLRNSNNSMSKSFRNFNSNDSKSTN